MTCRRSRRMPSSEPEPARGPGSDKQSRRSRRSSKGPGRCLGAPHSPPAAPPLAPPGPSEPLCGRASQSSVEKRALYRLLHTQPGTSGTELNLMTFESLNLHRSKCYESPSSMSMLSVASRSSMSLARVLDLQNHSMLGAEGL